MDQAKAEFVRLCDEAIREVEAMQNEYLAAGDPPAWAHLLTRLTQILVRLRQSCIDDVLPRPGRGRLGLSYAVSEWGLVDKGPHGVRVYDACWNLDNYYEDNYR